MQQPAPRPFASDDALSPDQAWALLRAAARCASAGRPICETAGVGLDASGELELRARTRADVIVRPDLELGWSPSRAVTPEAAQLLDLYMPLCVGARSASLVVAHLGQSLDSRIAADGGKTLWITGAEDVRHTHRLRALFDAVVVGAHTVQNDDPQLTTRLVAGSTPTRVVIDPKRRLARHYRVFADHAAPTLLATCCAPEARPARGAGGVPTLTLPSQRSGLDLAALLVELAKRGLRRVFIEGGGVTVSRFLRAGLVDRLQLAIAPCTLGQGPLGIPLELAKDRRASLGYRRFELGNDVLFDCSMQRVPWSMPA